MCWARGHPLIHLICLLVGRWPGGSTSAPKRLKKFRIAALSLGDKGKVYLPCSGRTACLPGPTSSDDLGWMEGDCYSGFRIGKEKRRRRTPPASRSWVSVESAGAAAM
jgi:hypothetical protein